MMRDTHGNKNVVRAVSPVAIGTTGTGKTGVVIDIQGYSGVEFLFEYGTVTATNAVFTATLLECDTTGGSFTSVADGDMLPQVGAEAAAGLAAAATRTSGVSKNVTKRLGYIGNKRYLKPKLTSTITAGTPIAINAVLESANFKPVA